MLCFLPPAPGAPRREEPLPPRRTAIGIGVALILVIAGMVLPHLRPAAHHTDRPHVEPGDLPQ